MKKYQAPTIDEAKGQAAADLGCAEADLAVTIQQEPRKGFLGFFARPAIILAGAKAELVGKAAENVSAEETAEEAAATTATEAPASAAEAVVPSEVTEPTPVADSAEDSAAEEPAVASDNAAADQPAPEDDQLTPEEIAARHAANEAKMQEASQALGDYLVAVYRELGVTVEPEVTRLRAHDLDLNLQSDAPGRVIGYHGRRLNALESLSQTFLRVHGIKDPVVNLDVGDYRAHRQETLQRLAEDSVVEVIATNQAVFLDPMPAKERKFVHQLLEDNDRVRTYSHGREPRRSLVIAPA